MCTNNFYHLQTLSAFWSFHTGVKKPSKPSSLHDLLLTYTDSRSVSLTYTYRISPFFPKLTDVSQAWHSFFPQTMVSYWNFLAASVIPLKTELFLLIFLRLAFRLWKLTDPASSVLKTNNINTINTILTVAVSKSRMSLTSFMHYFHGTICKEYLPSLAQKSLPSHLLTSAVHSKTPVASGTLFCHWGRGTINAPSLALLSIQLTTLWITSLLWLWNFILVMAKQDTYWSKFHEIRAKEQY